MLDLSRAQAMKTLTLKEVQALYGLELDDAVLAEGPVRLEHGGQTIGILVPAREYEAFCAWREARHMPQTAQPWREPPSEEVEAFRRMLPELLPQYRGRVAAIYRGQLVEIGAPGESVAQVAGRAYERLGYVPLYVQAVEDAPRAYRVPGPRRAHR